MRDGCCTSVSAGIAPILLPLFRASDARHQHYRRDGGRARGGVADTTPALDPWVPPLPPPMQVQGDRVLEIPQEDNPWLVSDRSSVCTLSAPPSTIGMTAPSIAPLTSIDVMVAIADGQVRQERYVNTPIQRLKR